MSDETARLHLAELVSLQELNAVTWNEALAKIDALVDLYLLGQYVNTPPSSPQDGDVYLTGGAPTGAWSGYPYKLAACLDGGWRIYMPFNGLRAYLAPTGAFLIYLNGVWSDCSSLVAATEQSIASAATCDLGAANALFVQITGNTTITSFGSGAGKLRFVRFAQGLTLTHNATSLVLLGNVSRTAAAGDVGLYASDGAGNWRERQYWRAATNPGDVATKSGAETLSNKTFVGATAFPGGVWNDGGNLGVCTTQPQRPVHIALDAGAGQAAIRVENTSTNAAGTAAVELKTGAAANPWQVFVRNGDFFIGVAGDLFQITAAGTVKLNSILPVSDNGQDIGSDALRFRTVRAATVTANALRLAASAPPASASASGTAGQIAYDASYLYVCTATNTWKRAALSSW